MIKFIVAIALVTISAQAQAGWLSDDASDMAKKIESEFKKRGSYKVKDGGTIKNVSASGRSLYFSYYLPEAVTRSKFEQVLKLEGLTMETLKSKEKANITRGYCRAKGFENLVKAGGEIWYQTHLSNGDHMYSVVVNYCP